MNESNVTTKDITKTALYELVQELISAAKLARPEDVELYARSIKQISEAISLL